MGSPEGEVGRREDETRHLVKITKGFWLGETEVTDREWRRVMGTDRFPSDGLDRPKGWVSWDQASLFCRDLSRAEKKRYRLPTEAEWEYSCRAGTTTPFHTGATIGTDQANFDGSSPYSGGVKGENRDRPVRTGSFRPNAWGLYDMHGNVEEWVADRYGPYKLPGSGTRSQGQSEANGISPDLSPSFDPMGPPAGEKRILRGWSWFNLAVVCRSACRNANPPGGRTGYTGFRVALDR